MIVFVGFQPRIVEAEVQKADDEYVAGVLGQPGNWSRITVPFPDQSISLLIDKDRLP